MKKKRIIISIVVLVLLVIIGFTGYFVFIKQDENTTLTLIDKKWIEDNKNTIIDLGIVNDVPVFNNEGAGVLFDFIDSLESNTGLEFNRLSFQIGKEEPSAYAFTIVDKVLEDDIVIYEDNYAILTNKKEKYNSLESIPTMTLGVFTDDLESVNYYLTDNKNLSFKTYDTMEELLKAFTDSTLTGIVVPKTFYLEQIITNENLNISYNITEMRQNLVLRLGDTGKLNKIISKYYKKWSKDNLSLSYSDHFSETYFSFHNMTEQEIDKFRSKSYIYGFINYAPYDETVDGRLVGYNKELIRNFAQIANVDVKYKEYNKLEDLQTAFNENKVDFMFNFNSLDSYNLDVVNSISTYNEEIGIVTSIENALTVNSIYSLKDKKVSVIKNSIIANVLSKEGIKLNEYDNLDKLLSSLNKESIVAIDVSTYDTYVRNKLQDYKLKYSFDLEDDYYFTIRDISDHKLFGQFFNFYLSYTNEENLISSINYQSFEEPLANKKAITILLIGIVILVVMFVILFFNKQRGKKIKIPVNKESKLRYIDMLTSLKNRTYLNDSMNKWDESEIYPQSIIIVDLNNIAYINDNYGHEEGDKVITEAANILIKTQIENSEIIRTDGNEFLIYLVEYEEKQVVSYIRKLNKDFKDLSHGFGSAIGYSMIQDGIKTIDDAINEATLDMRTNKEEGTN